MGPPHEKHRNHQPSGLAQATPDEDMGGETPQDAVSPAALGSPHDGYAAVVLTLALALVIFGFGAGQYFLSTVEADHWWWLPFAVAVMVFPIGLFSLKYYLRAHGGNGSHGAPMPMFAIFAAWMALALFFLEPLAGALGSYWLLAGACLVLATLMVAPVQMVLSQDPKRDSETT